MQNYSATFFHSPFQKSMMMEAVVVVQAVMYNGGRDGVKVVVVEPW